MNLGAGGVPALAVIALASVGLVFSARACYLVLRKRDARRAGMVAVAAAFAATLVGTATYLHWEVVLGSPALTETGGDVDARLAAQAAARAAGGIPLLAAIALAPLPGLSGLAAYFISWRRNRAGAGSEESRRAR